MTAYVTAQSSVMRLIQSKAYYPYILSLNRTWMVTEGKWLLGVENGDA